MTRPFSRLLLAVAAFALAIPSSAAAARPVPPTPSLPGFPTQYHEGSGKLPSTGLCSDYRTVLLQAGVYTTQTWVGRSDWVEGAKVSPVKRIRVPASGLYDWSVCLNAWASGHRSGRYWFANKLEASSNLFFPYTGGPVGGTDLMSQYAPRFSTNSGLGTYTWGAWLQLRPPPSRAV